MNLENVENLENLKNLENLENLSYFFGTSFKTRPVALSVSR